LPTEKTNKLQENNNMGFAIKAAEVQWLLGVSNELQ